LTLRQAAISLGFVSDAEFDKWIIPLEMTDNKRQE